MSNKLEKKIVRDIPQSEGPLPPKFAGQFDGLLLVFSDASLQTHGGLAAVLFSEPETNLSTNLTAEAVPIRPLNFTHLTNQNGAVDQSVVIGQQSANSGHPTTERRRPA